MRELELIYQDEALISVNKPPGLLVHPGSIARDATDSAMQILRDQTGSWVYPAHRIDRKTSGVLMFTKTREANSIVQRQFREGTVQKSYLAIVRGFTEDSGLIDYPLKHENGQLQQAVTEFITLDRTEINLPSAGFPTSRYSLLLIRPQTGRFHQIRRHLAHIRHPVIGDRPHGCNKQNRLFRDYFGTMRMFLHAEQLALKHPTGGQTITLFAPPDADFSGMLKSLNFTFDIHSLQNH
ncbi:MAG: tRNA pseudouridine(65) synthase TruC [Bacteroidales bacterium]